MNKHSFIINRRKLYMLFFIIIISVLSLTIAYASLAATLTIAGNAEVTSSTWDVHFDNVKIDQNSIKATKEPTITNSKTIDFAVTLKEPGDYYKFTVDIVNSGTIDAMIDSIEKIPQLSETQAKYLKYEIEYSTGASINTNQLLSKGSTKTLTVKVTYRSDLTSTDLPTQSEKLNLSFTMNYTQANDNYNIEPGAETSIVKVKSGDLNTIGSEVCIDTECFYVISSTESTTTMLSKYNLYVGGYFDGTNWTAYGSEATGLQEETMLGSITSNNPGNGATPFSNDTQKGTEYNDYEGSLVEIYVNNYKTYLETKVNIQEARLLTSDELIELGCNKDELSCRTTPEFIYATSYWLGTKGTTYENVNYIYYIRRNGDFSERPYSDVNAFGVRPVITISKY